MNVVDIDGGKLSDADNSVPNTAIEATTFDRLAPRQVGTGVTLGTQSVGSIGPKIDGSNNRISIDDVDGNGLALGNINETDNSFGLSVSDDDGTPRLLAGKYPSGDIKIKLSQEGYDVSTATDDQLIWSSDFNSFKIINSDVAIIDTVPDPFVAGNEFTTSVAHEQGEPPTCLVWVDAPDTGGFTVDAQTVQVPIIACFGAAGGGVAISIHYSVDDTNITFKIRNVAGVGLSGVGSTWSFRYYILKETVSTT